MQEVNPCHLNHLTLYYAQIYDRHGCYKIYQETELLSKTQLLYMTSQAIQKARSSVSIKRKQFTTRPQRIALFVTCMVDMIYPDVGTATVALLEKNGVEVIFPVEQTCCGQPAFNAGFQDEARQLALRFIDIFEPLLVDGYIDAIVAPSGSCTTMVSHFYETLSTHEEKQRFETVGAATFELTEFLVDVLGITDVGAQYNGNLTYHACCHLLRELKVNQQPRTLLDNIAGANIVPLPEGEECCGFGGLFSIKNAEISTAMGRRKTLNIAQSGADLVTLCDVSCMTHINGLLERQAQGCRAVHIAEVLNNQVGMSQAPLSTQPEQPILVEAPSRRWQDEGMTG